MTAATPDPLVTHLAEPMLEQVRQQARRYMEARYGKDVWFRAPETFGNMLERWIWAVASGEMEFAGDCMTQIEDALKPVQS